MSETIKDENLTPNPACCESEENQGPNDGEIPEKASGLKAAHEILYRQIIHAIVVLVIVGLAEYTAYTFLAAFPKLQFLDPFRPWLVFLDVTVVFLAATLHYLRLYHYAHVGCMNSMMIGMSVGMQVGMMMGAIFGGADGYFVGCVLGVLLGSGFGVFSTWRSGPVGITQGLMSGLMGGTMGSMIIVMMPLSRLMVFLSFFTSINLAILIGFWTFFAREAVHGEKCLQKSSPSVLKLLMTSVMVIGVLFTTLIVLSESSPFLKG